MVQTEPAEEGIAFMNDQDVVSAGEKGDAFFGMRPPRIAEECGRNLHRRGRGSGPRPYEGRGSLGCQLLDGRRSGGKNIAVRTGILRFADPLQEVDMKPGFLYVERLEFRIRRKDAGNRCDLRVAGEI